MGRDIYAGRGRNDLGSTHSNFYGPECWWLSASEYSLNKAGRKIKLTVTEHKILLAFISSNWRVLSRDDLIRLLNKNPDTYTGLEMCLSRLQQKFCSEWGDCRLLRAVRNRGYCLVQNINLARSPAPDLLKSNHSVPGHRRSV